MAGIDKKESLGQINFQIFKLALRRIELVLAADNVSSRPYQSILSVMKHGQPVISKQIGKLESKQLQSPSHLDQPPTTIQIYSHLAHGWSVPHA